jgi:hypothetical protein
MHDRLKRHVGARLKSLESGTGINWGTAEVREFMRHNEALLTFGRHLLSDPSCWKATTYAFQDKT